MSDYELTMCTQGKYEVTVSGVNYSLTEVNSRTLPLIESEKQKMLMKINLQEMLGNLLNSTKLLDIVYCSVSSMGALQAEVSRLQVNLLKDITDSELVMDEFCSKTESILDELVTVYPLLYTGRNEKAIRIFVSIKEHAVEMCQKAETLRDIFVKRCDDTDGILTKTIYKNEELYARRDKIQEEIANMNAELDAAEALKEILEEQIRTMNKEYEDLEKKEEKAANRAFSMELTGAILGGIGELFSTIVPIKELLGGKDTETQSKETEMEEQAIDEVSEQAVQQNEKVQEKQKKIDNLEQKISQLKKEIAEIENKLKADIPKAEYDKLRADGVRKQKELEELEGQKATEEKSVDKIKDALKAVGNSFSKAAEKQQSNVEAYNKRLQEVYRLKQEVQKQDAANKAKIAEYTGKVASSIDRRDTLDLSVKSLTMAIGCMRRIVVILNETVLFWKSIARCCDNLSKTKLIEDIEESVETELLPDETPFYMQRLFVKTFLLYLIHWTALNLISGEYLDAMDQVRSELGTRMGRIEGSREKQWELAAEMAKDLQI